MTSFWNRPVWYVALLRCVVGGITATATLFAGRSVIPTLGELMMQPLSQRGKVEQNLSDWLVILLFLLVFVGGCVFLAVRCGKWSAVIAYRGQDRVRFVPKYALTLLFAYLSWKLLVHWGLPELVYSRLVDALSLDWQEREGLLGSMIMYVIGYSATYTISLLVYHYVELAKEPPVEEP